jgi:hypothetical protein
MDALTYFKELHEASIKPGNIRLKMMNNGFTKEEHHILGQNSFFFRHQKDKNDYKNTRIIKKSDGKFIVNRKRK